MKNLLAVFVLLAAGLSVTHAEARCVRVALLDQNGSVVQPNGLVIGIEIGENPVFTQALPEHRNQRVIGAVDCPREVIDPIRNLYTLSCASEQAMRQTSINNSQSVLVVQQRCQELEAALLAGR